MGTKDQAKTPNSVNLQSFADVPYEDGVVTVEFLEASDGFVNMFGKNTPVMVNHMLNMTVLQISSELVSSASFRTTYGPT